MTHGNPVRNDYWEVLWKINQILIPIGLGWAIWVTSNVFELKSQVLKPDEKFTKADSLVLELGIKDWVRENFPTPEEKLQLKDIQTSVKDVASQVGTLRLDVAKIQILQGIRQKESK